MFWGGVQMGCSGFEHNPVEYARAVKCNTLMLHGAEDRSAKPEEAKAVLDNLRGVKEMVAFPGAGHESLYDVDSVLWSKSISQFLANMRSRQ
ncbi:MAG: prolyl oligopeptidase family serine peptidase [Pirellulales bacterium]